MIRMRRVQRVSHRRERIWASGRQRLICMLYHSIPRGVIHEVISLSVLMMTEGEGIRGVSQPD